MLVGRWNSSPFPVRLGKSNFKKVGCQINHCENNIKRSYYPPKGGTSDEDRAAATEVLPSASTRDLGG